MTPPRLHGLAHAAKRGAKSNPPERRNSSMRSTLFAVIYSLITILIFAPAVQAQNTGGVFPPGFGDNHESIQYRIAYNTENDNFANRLHYQKSIDEKRLWRVVVQTREAEDSDFDFDFFQAELFWELGNRKSKWRKAVRFDGRLRDNDRPAQIGLNFANQFNLGDGWSARANGLSNLMFGDNSQSGIGLAGRANIAKKLQSGPSIGIEYFGNYGTTQSFSVGKSGQTIGPFASTKLTGNTSIFAGVQFGITDVAADTDLRLWLTQGF